LAQGGGFSGTITGNKSVFTFSGNGTLGPAIFLLNGIKTSNIP